MKFWLIRDTLTHYTLPASYGGAFTRAEFDKSPPRLFASKSAATRALTWWLKGHVFASTTKMVHRQTFVGGEHHVRPRKDRNPARVEVIPVSIVEGHVIGRVVKMSVDTSSTSA